jgi:hypothetical protein
MIPFEDMVRKALSAGDTLSEAERARMRAVLTEYAAFKPVRAPVRHVSPFHALRMHPVFAGAFALLLLITSTGGAAYAAEGSLPGDILYSVKVDVTEPVVTALTPAGSAQVAWHLTIAKRRLAEAHALATAGRLASSTEVSLVGKAADATLQSAVLASALPDAHATTSAASASSTEGLITASQLILEARSKLKEHDATGATKAFRASIRAAAKLEALTQTAGMLELDEDEEAATSTPREPSTGSTTEATSSDQSAAVIEGVVNVENSQGGEGEDKGSSAHAHASTTIRILQW